MEFTENTFENGMHVDNDISLQPKGTYRFSKNGYVFDIGQNNYVWHQAKGTLKLESYPSGYKPIGMISARDKLIIISISDDKSLVSFGWVVESSGVYVFTPFYIYSNSSFAFSILHKIKGYSYYENEDIERIYFTDGATKPKAINLNAIEFGFTYEKGKRYLVLSGKITHQNNEYFPGDSFIYWDANGFDLGGSAVIKFIDPEIFDWSPEIKFEELKDFEIIEGSLETGTYYFTYRFITEFDNSTPWSPLSKPFTLYRNKLDEVPSDINDSIQRWNENTISNNADSLSGLRVTLNKIEYDKYKYVQFACFRILNDSFDTGVIFSQKSIPVKRESSTYNDEYFASISSDIVSYSGEFLTFEDFALQNISIDKLGDLDTIKKLNTISDVTEEAELNLGSSMPTLDSPIKTNVYSMPADVLSHSNYDNNDIPLAGVYKLNIHGNINSGEVLIGQFYKVVDEGTLYNGVTYSEGDLPILQEV